MCGWAVGKGKWMGSQCEAEKFNHAQFELDKIGVCGTVQWVLGIQDKTGKGMVGLRVVKLVKP